MKLFLRACPAVKGFEGYREKGENVRICRNTAVDLPGKEKMNILHEILRTVLVREFGEILLVGAIIVLRAALTLLIHWEIKNEKAEMES